MNAWIPRLTAVVTVVALSLACGSAEDPAGGGAPASAATPAAAAPSGPITITATLDDAQKAAAEALKPQAKNGGFPSAERKKDENALIFLTLAAANGEPGVTAAALDGMTETWGANDKSKATHKVDADYVAVVRAHLDSADNVVRARAIMAAKKVLLSPAPDVGVVDRLADIASNDANPAARFAVLDVLWTKPDWEKDAKLAGVYLGALSAKEPHLVSEALFRMIHDNGLVNKAEIQPKVEGLLTHADPGVRGRAALALMEVARTDDERTAAVAKITPLLADAAPFAKAAAAVALGHSKNTSVVASLMPLLDDKSDNTYDITGWTELDGSAGRLHHDASAWSRVDEAALLAIKGVTSSKGVDKYEMRKIESKTSAADIDAAVGECKAWYEAHKGAL